MLTIADVERAQARIAGRVRRTPLSESAALTRLTGCQVHLKLENLQFTGSFKERGAAARLLLLSDAERARGVITASAGNHAQAVAYAASVLGIKAVIVMPQSTPQNYVDATRGEGVGPLVNLFFLVMASEAFAGAGILLVVVGLLWRVVRRHCKPVQ